VRNFLGNCVSCMLWCAGIYIYSNFDRRKLLIWHRDVRVAPYALLENRVSSCGGGSALIKFCASLLGGRGIGPLKRYRKSDTANCGV
jgi:hypothetical protein